MERVQSKTSAPLGILSTASRVNKQVRIVSTHYVTLLMYERPGQHYVWVTDVQTQTVTHVQTGMPAANAHVCNQRHQLTAFRLEAA